jgi:hypothetical protein
VCQEQPKDWYETHQTAFNPMEGLLNDRRDCKKRITFNPREGLYNDRRNCNKRPKGHIAHLSHIGSFSLCNHLQKWFSLLLSHPISGGHGIIWNSFLHLNRKFLCKFELIWCSGSRGDLFIILSLLKNTFKMGFPNLPADSGKKSFKDFFPIQTHVKMVFPLWPYPATSKNQSKFFLFI